jgi:hypothetical protein
VPGGADSEIARGLLKRGRKALKHGWLRRTAFRQGAENAVIAGEQRTDAVGLLWHVNPAQRYGLDLSEDILPAREAQLLPGFLGYARQEPRASAVLAQGHGRQD